MDQPTPFNPNPIPGHEPDPDPVPIPDRLVSGPTSASIPPVEDRASTEPADRSVSVGVSGAEIAKAFGVPLSVLPVSSEGLTISDRYALRVPLLDQPTVDPDHLSVIYPECSVDHLGTTVLYLTLREILWKQSRLLGRMDEVEEAAGLISRFLLPHRDESRQEYLTRLGLMLPVL